MSKIMILANSSAGLYDFRNELVQELLKYHSVVISLPDEVKSQLLAEEGCTVVKTALNRRSMNPLKDMRLMREYQTLLRKHRPDLVLMYTVKPIVYGGIACQRLGIPYIPTITGLGSAFERGGSLLRVVEDLYRRGLRGASCVFFQNEENRHTFLKEGLVTGGLASTRLVPGSGVNLRVHPFAPYPEDGVTRFLFVGRMMREKGIEELLAAAEALHGEQIVFELVGYCDEDYQTLLDEKEKEGVIRQLGFHPDVQEYYRKCSAVVMPTYHEGMSNVLMEASATGRPVIATNISGCREVFEEEVTGFGFAPKSAEALIGALREFLSLSRADRAAMGRAARAKMEREFDRGKVVAAYMKEINRVLEAKNGTL